LAVLALIEWRGRLLLVAVSTVALFVAAIEFFAAAILFALISETSAPGSGVEALATAAPVRLLLRDGVWTESPLVTLAVLAVGAVVVKAALNILRLALQHRVIHSIGVRMSERMLSAYLHMPYQHHLERGVAELVRNSHSAVREVVASGLTRILTLVSATATAVALVGVIATTNPSVAIGSAIVMGGLAAILILVVQPRLKRAGRRSHAIERDLLATLHETLQGIREIRLAGAEAPRLRTFVRLQRHWARNRRKAVVLKELPRVAIEMTVVAGLAVLLVVGAGREGGGSAVPLLGLLSYVGLRLQPAVKEIATSLNDLRFLAAPVEDLRRDLVLYGAVAPSPATSAEPVRFAEGIRLRSVSFTHSTASRPSIEAIDLWIPSGARLGIIGPTGGGKSTLVDILSGLLAPTDGTVEIDGSMLKVPDPNWYAMVAVVSQRPLLFEGTIASNVALGVPPSQVDVDLLVSCIEKAQLSAVVGQLPDGLATPIGERGNRLSGGEQQRIAIARALYRRPRVLILDEATSALDEDTEHRLTKILTGLDRSTTIIVVSHRPGPLALTDGVISVENGRITSKSGVGADI